MHLPALACSLLAAAALAACGAAGNGSGAPGADSPAPGPAEPGILLEGTQGPLRAGEVVARTVQEWEAAWRDHEGPGDPPDVANVDFSESLVVGLFAGQRPTGGFRVVAGEVRREPAGSAYTLAYEVISPGNGCLASQALTAPFAVVLAPAADTVNFSAAEVTRDCL